MEAIWMEDKSDWTVLLKGLTELKVAKVASEETEEALEAIAVLVIKATQQSIWVLTIKMQRKEQLEVSKEKR